MSKRTMAKLSECIPVFSMLQDENRQKILMYLFDNGEMSVSEITDLIDLSRPTVSHHLKLLLVSGLVTVRKNGKERYYKIQLDHSIELLESLIASLKEDYKSKL